MFPILDLVDELRAVDLSNAADVGQRTGVAISASPADSNRYFRVLRGEGSAKFPQLRRVELRIPVNVTETTSRGIIVLEVDPAKDCIGPGDLESRYGKDHGMIVPTPHQPAQSPIGFTYVYPEGELTFGISQASPACLVSVLVDRKR